MAGSYKHCVTDDGKLRGDSLADLVDNLSDAWEAIEEMYGMIWWLAGGDATQVERARQYWQEGIQHYSPGVEAED